MQKYGDKSIIPGNFIDLGSVRKIKYKKINKKKYKKFFKIL